MAYFFYATKQKRETLEKFVIEAHMKIKKFAFLKLKIKNKIE